MILVNEVEAKMLQMRDDRQCAILSRFFKTGKGEYGEGDKFLGIRVPQTREVVKVYKYRLSLNEIQELLHSPWHEIRLCGFLLLVEEMKAALPKKRETERYGKAKRRNEITDFYLANAKQANNWDLVDLSCPYIVGNWLLYPLEDNTFPDKTLLDRLSGSKNLWEQRISIVSTLQLIRAGRLDDTLRIADKLLYHKQDLIQKAVGWALRELGKKDIEMLRAYLKENCPKMARTTLRYAIERMCYEERRFWLKR